MTPNIIFMGWNEAKTGREGRAMELFQRVQGWYGKLQSEGEIESHETILIGRHGGDMNGFTVIRGDSAKLAALRTSDEMTEVIMEASLCLDGFGILDAYGGAELMNVMSKWGEAVAKS